MYKKQMTLQRYLCLGAEVYMDMQDFNQLFLRGSIGLILLSVLLFVTSTHSRRRYYVGNYAAVGLFSAASIAFTVWAHGQIEAFKAQFLTIDFAKLLTHATSRKTLYTESTFWFDIHYLVFGLLLVGVVLLILNAVWKSKLMKDEQALIAQGKEAV